MTIWKYELTLAETQVFEMPRGAKGLTVHTESNIPYLYMLVEERADLWKHRIRVYVTEEPITLGMVGVYVGVWWDGGFAHHVFDWGEIS